MVNLINMLHKIINFFIPKYTQDWSDNTEKQCYEIQCYKNGKYTHTVNMYYFTKEEIENFKQK